VGTPFVPTVGVADVTRGHEKRAHPTKLDPVRIQPHLLTPHHPIKIPPLFKRVNLRYYVRLNLPVMS